MSGKPGAPRWLAVLVKLRFLIMCLLGAYGFWLVGLPFWCSTVKSFNAVEELAFGAIAALSPLTVPAILMFYTFAARPLYGEQISTICAVWAIAAVALILSILIVRLSLARLQKAWSIQ